MAQVPVLHRGAAFENEHVFEQVPQCVTEVLTLVSQPFDWRPSQLPQPELHVWMRQLPVPHVAVALVREHDMPHPPQCVRVVSDCSQPFASLPSQLPHPGLHVATRHVPVEQSPVPFATVHVDPHAPQCATVLRRCSQPLPGSVSQLP